MATSEALKGAEAAAIAEQKKASEIMAERLPGLIDPNFRRTSSRCWTVRTPIRWPTRRALHPDRFTPGAHPDRFTPGTGRARTKARRNRSQANPPRTARTRARQPKQSPPASQSPSPARGIHSHDPSGRRFRRDLEVRRYPILVYALVPLAALVLQAWLPRVWGAMPGSTCRWWSRSISRWAGAAPIQGTLMGAGMGLFEDALTIHAIGVNGVAKTVVGFLAASVGIRIDVENHTIRLGLTFLLSLLSSAIYVFVYRILLGLEVEWSWLTSCSRRSATR
jgi:rod shape-determining protein MreD